MGIVCDTAMAFFPGGADMFCSSGPSWSFAKRKEFQPEGHTSLWLSLLALDLLNLSSDQPLRMILYCIDIANLVAMEKKKFNAKFRRHRFAFLKHSVVIFASCSSLN